MPRPEYSPNSREWVQQRTSDIAAQYLRTISAGLSTSTRGLDQTPSLPVALNAQTATQLHQLAQFGISSQEMLRILSSSEVSSEHSPMLARLQAFAVAMSKRDPDRSVSVLTMANVMNMFAGVTEGGSGIVPVTITMDNDGFPVTHPIVSEGPKLRGGRNAAVYVPELPWEAAQEAIGQYQAVTKYNQDAMLGVREEPLGAQSVARTVEQNGGTTRGEMMQTPEQKAAPIFNQIRPVFDRLLRLDRALFDSGAMNDPYVRFYAASPFIGFTYEGVHHQEAEMIKVNLKNRVGSAMVKKMNNFQISLDIDPNDPKQSVLHALRDLDAEFALLTPYALPSRMSPLTSALYHGFTVEHTIVAVRLRYFANSNRMLLLIQLNREFNDEIFLS